MKSNHKTCSRRAFLTSAVASALVGGCGFRKDYLFDHAEELETTPRKKFAGDRSTVGLIQCESYEEDMIRLIKPHLSSLGLPDLSGKTVLVKPNMVEYRPNRQITTNPAVVMAAAQLADYLGARRVIVAEGPGHMRDTEFLLDMTGLGKACSKLGIEFVDLNLDDLEKVDNKHGFTSADHLYLPRTLMEADAVISCPKLKTHHWVGVTASMKNLFGTVPGRKYGWPKNMLHWMGINETIVDLVHMIRPAFAFVDAVVSMEGDGPLDGDPRDTQFLLLGTDLAAVDATGQRAIGVDPLKLKYMKYAGKVIGNVDESNIDVIGSPVSKVHQELKLPTTHIGKVELGKAKSQAS